MKPTTMLFRDLMAMDVEECILAHRRPLARVERCSADGLAGGNVSGVVRVA